MNTLLIAVQILCYRVGIVSASLNMATSVRCSGNDTVCARAAR